MDATSEELNRHFEVELLELKNNEPITSLQFLAQVSLLLVCSITGWWALGLWQMMVWFFVYYSSVALEKLWLARLPEQMSRRSFFLVLAFLTVNAFLFNALPLFLWFQDNDVLKYATLALVAGTMLHSFLTRARCPSVLSCYLIADATTFLILCYGIFLKFGLSGEFLAAAVFAVAIASYFVVGLLEAHMRENRLAQSIHEQTQAQCNEILVRLTDRVSHDFNNLLSVISGSLQLLRDTDDEGERSDLIETALSASTHISELIRRMQAIGQRAHLDPEPINTAETLRALRSSLAPILPKTIELKIEVSETTPWIHADAKMLQTALLALILNARASMPNGGQLVVNAQRSEERPTGLVEISVSDTGTGIPVQIRERVFDPFFTTGRLGEGSGFDLAMVKGFVEQSGGNIDLGSFAEQGTCVTLQLPITAQAQNSRTSSDQRMSIVSRTQHILVVDDNKQLLELIALKLERDGYWVTKCGSGDEAKLLLMSGGTPDVLLSDVVMPGDLQGHDLARWARARYPNLFVILMSGHLESEDKSVIDVADADHFFAKPIELSELSNKINSFFASQSQNSS